MNRKELLEKLNYALKVVPTESNAILPITQNVLFEKGLIITTNVTDFVSVEAEYKGESFAAPIRPLIAFLKAITDEEVFFSYDEESKNLEIKTTDGKKAHFNDLDDPDDFIKTPEVVGEIIKVDKSFIDKISKSTEFISADFLRPAMTGVCFDKKHIVGTDGHRIYFPEHGQDLNIGDLEVIINGVMAKKLINSKIMHSELTEITITESHLKVVSGEFTVIGKLIDEKYPKWNNDSIIPSETFHTLKVDRKELMEAINSSLIFANKTTRQVVFDISTEEAVLITDDLDYSNGFNTKLRSAEIEGDSIKIGFNGKYLLSVINAIEEDYVEIKMVRANKGVVINGMFILMPVMLGEYV